MPALRESGPPQRSMESGFCVQAIRRVRAHRLLRLRVRCGEGVGAMGGSAEPCLRSRRWKGGQGGRMRFSPRATTPVLRRRSGMDFARPSGVAGSRSGKGRIIRPPMGSGRAPRAWPPWSPNSPCPRCDGDPTRRMLQCGVATPQPRCLPAPRRMDYAVPWTSTEGDSRRQTGAFYRGALEGN
jgi:hypothetical protein